MPGSNAAQNLPYDTFWIPAVAMAHFRSGKLKVSLYGAPRSVRGAGSGAGVGGSASFTLRTALIYLQAQQGPADPSASQALK